MNSGLSAQGFKMRQVSANELMRRLKAFFLREERRWNRGNKKFGIENDKIVEYMVIEKRDADHVEVRTDSLAYEMFYDSSTADYPSLMHPYHTRFYDFIRKLGWNMEAEGGGILTLFR